MSLLSRRHLRSRLRPPLGRRGQAARAAAVAASGGGVVGPARVDRRTKALTKRLRPGDVAVIDHGDIDRVSAEALVACRPGAVVNAAASTSGRYPNLGPEILVAAGIPLLDQVGSAVMDALADGQLVHLDGERLLLLAPAGGPGERVMARGRLLTADAVARATDEARAGMSAALEAFAANTMEHLQRERALLLDGVGVPEVRTRIDGRPALVVVRGYSYQEDLLALRSWVREYRPVVIGVDGGADAVVAAGYHLDMVVGDMDSVSDGVLTSGVEVVVHAYPDGRAPGLQRVRALGVEPVVFPATGTSEDVAMLLADDKGAQVIVAVGTHATLVEFLDKGRAGMASTFLTRLRVGSKLVDAKGVSRLYRPRISDLQLLALVLAGLLALGAALATTALGQTALSLLAGGLEDLWVVVRGLWPGG
jgi:uncharacterized membrane-anchored protein